MRLIFHLEIELVRRGDDDPARDLSGGSTTSTPVGFVATLDRPDECEATR